MFFRLLRDISLLTFLTLVIIINNVKRLRKQDINNIKRVLINERLDLLLLSKVLLLASLTKLIENTNSTIIISCIKN